MTPVTDRAFAPPMVEPAALPRTETAPDDVTRVASDFEAMFLGLFINDMMKDTMPSTMSGGHGEEIFRSLLGNEIGKAMAEAGGFGIAASVEKAIRAYSK